MKVRDVLKLLKNFPLDAEICVGHSGGCFDVKSIEYYKVSKRFLKPNVYARDIRMGNNAVIIELGG